jgi:hypothetical protein
MPYSWATLVEILDEAGIINEKPQTTEKYDIQANRQVFLPSASYGPEVEIGE